MIRKERLQALRFCSISFTFEKKRALLAGVCQFHALLTIPTERIGWRSARIVEQIVTVLFLGILRRQIFEAFHRRGRLQPSLGVRQG